MGVAKCHFWQKNYKNILLLSGTRGWGRGWSPLRLPAQVRSPSLLNTLGKRICRNSGIAKLFGADFSECRHQADENADIDSIDVPYLLRCLNFLFTFRDPPYSTEHNKAFDMAIANIVDKFSDKGYNLVVYGLSIWNGT
eukprot:sb/3474365/